jgi:A118 family predicted phage portal protein
MNPIKQAAHTVRGWFNNPMNATKVLEVFKVKPIISPSMDARRAQYMAYYRGQAPHNLLLKKDGKTRKYPSLFTAATICGKFAKDVATELKTEVKGEYINEQYQRFINSKLRGAVEKCCAGGMVALRPFLENGQIHVTVSDISAFIVTGTNALFDITGIVFEEKFSQDNKHYTLFELCSFELAAGQPAAPGQPAPQVPVYRVLHRAMLSDTYDGDGQEVQLADVPCWAHLQPETVIHGAASRPWFVIVKQPGENIHESNSVYGVPVFDRAMEWIIKADIHAARFDRELSVTERMIDVSTALLKLTPDKESPGKLVHELPETDEKLYRVYPGEPESGDIGIKEWGGKPNILDYEAYDDYLARRTEGACDAFIGMISKPPTDIRTAAAVISSRQDYAANVLRQQEVWENAMKDLATVMGEIAAYHQIAPAAGEVTPTWEAGEVAIIDRATQLQEKLGLMAAGVLSADYVNAWYFGKEITEEMKNTPTPFLEQLQMQGEEGEPGDDVKAGNIRNNARRTGEDSKDGGNADTNINK